MNLKIILFFFFASLPFGGTAWGQKQIELKNPSFESSPTAGLTPPGWVNLGAEHETPPDIQPGFFGVSLEPQDGDTYLGLVVRGSSNTWEGVGQRLNDFLKRDSTYSFSLWLTRSNSYKSPMKSDPEIVNFINPTILKIWGYNTRTKQEELLAESQPVGHSKWIRYEFVLKPTLTDFDELDLMAYFAPGFEGKNGNLLIDNCSPILEIKK